SVSIDLRDPEYAGPREVSAGDQYVRVIAPPHDRLEVRWPEHLLLDRESALVETLVLLDVAAIPLDRGEVHEHRGDFVRLRPRGGLTRSECAPIRGRGRVEVAQVVERGPEREVGLRRLQGVLADRAHGGRGGPLG